LIDNVLAVTAIKSGYTFTAAAGAQTPSVTYASTGYAQVQGQSGQREFCSDQSGVIRANATAATCSNADQPL
jgi:hypothetical protein